MILTVKKLDLSKSEVLVIESFEQESPDLNLLSALIKAENEAYRRWGQDFPASSRTRSNVHFARVWVCPLDHDQKIEIELTKGSA